MLSDQLSLKEVEVMSFIVIVSIVGGGLFVLGYSSIILFVVLSMFCLVGFVKGMNSLILALGMSDKVRYKLAKHAFIKCVVSVALLFWNASEIIQRF